jgi:hypothetical protein
MEQFACGYCGIAQRVERIGGTVALKPVTDAIAKVQLGTDKTAAELALHRLPHEINALTWQRSQSEAYWQQELTRVRGTGLDKLLLVGLACIVVTVGLLAAIASQISPASALVGLLLGFVLCAVASVMVMISLHRKISATRDETIRRILAARVDQIGRLDEQIRVLSEKLERNRAIANS